tara:strand:+ start:928 stop:1308 length:381 start_codon:yes stop_codon:yes gene_type:complete
MSLFKKKTVIENDYKQKYTLEERLVESNRILTKHVDRIPVILSKLAGSNVPEIEKRRYLIPNVYTVAQLIHIIRTRLNISEEKGIFIFVNGVVMPNPNEKMYELYSKEKDKDQFLYITYSLENTFG